MYVKDKGNLPCIHSCRFGILSEFFEIISDKIRVIQGNITFQEHVQNCCKGDGRICFEYY